MFGKALRRAALVVAVQLAAGCGDNVIDGLTSCGDGNCDAGEDCTSCAADCGACGAMCGDALCDAGEDCASCASDCGACGLCVTASATWAHLDFAAQTAFFTVRFVATPGAEGMDGVIGLSNGAAAAYTDLAAIVRFNPQGQIDARDGGVYRAANAIPYASGTPYYFSLDVNLTQGIYDAFVTPTGGSRSIIGVGLAFRTEQAAVTRLDTLSLTAGTGSEQVCDPRVSAPVCGDGTCGRGEDCAQCAADCGSCPVEDPLPEPGPTYYVDKNNPQASDANPGTQSLPWLTIQQAANGAQAGDTVLVKAGLYNEWVEIKNSGSPGKPITFKAYPGDRPIVDGSGLNVPSEPYWKALFYSIGNSYITIDGFEVRNSDEVLIRMRADNETSPRVSNIIIRNCLIHGNALNDRNGVHFEWVDDGLVEHNECYDSGWNCISVVSSNNVDVQYNYVHNNPKHAGINIFPKTYEDPQGLYRGNDILNNVVANIGNPGAAVYTRFQTDNVIAGNIIYGNSTGLNFDHNHTGTTYAHVANTIVINNTIVGNDYFGFRSINASGVTLLNNIFAYNGSADVAFESGTTAGSSADYNLYYDSVKLKWGSSSYSSLATWSSSTNNDRHSLSADPGFVSRNANDFTLTSSSSAIDAGTDVSAYGVETDLYGNARPRGRGFDIGACEY